MQEQLATELLKILRAVKILSPASLSFAGKICSVSENQQSDQQDSDEPASMVHQLGWELYVNCYCRQFDGLISNEAAVSSPDEQFLRELSSANTSRDYLDRGWKVLRQLPTGHYIAEKNGLTRTLFAGEFVTHTGLRGPVKEGASISIFCPRDSRTTLRGFYFVFGETILDEQDDSGLLRFYWNIKADGVARLIRLLTEQLNSFQLPFRLKVLNAPAAYNRSDAAVLYLNKRFYHLVAEFLQDVHQEIKEQLEAHTPLFSKKLAGGLGLAEEPHTGESFGQQRCRILAQGICKAYDLGLEDEQQRLEEIVKQFEVNGLNIDFPHLNPGSTDDYQFPSTST